MGVDLYIFDLPVVVFWPLVVLVAIAAGAALNYAVVGKYSPTKTRKTQVKPPKSQFGGPQHYPSEYR